MLRTALIRLFADQTSEYSTDVIDYVTMGIAVLKQQAPTTWQLILDIAKPPELKEGKRAGADDDEDEPSAATQKRITAAAVALSQLLTVRGQRFSGLQKVFGLAFVRLGVSRTVMNMLVKTGICCSYSTSRELLIDRKTDPNQV